MDGKESLGCGMSTVDGGKVVTENLANGAVDENMSQKRERKMTAKGVALLFENLQRSRKQKLNQVNNIKQKVNDIIYLKITSETVPNVEKQMKRFVKYCEEAEDLHNSIVEMPIPKDEFDKQTKWFDAKLAENQCFQKEITEWLSDAGRTLRADKTCDASSAVNSEIGPDDSISNVSTKQSQCSKVLKGSASTSSSTSSARIKAMAERAALVQHAASMEKKHTLEEEEERLRIQSERLKRQKEQLMMNAKIAANDARLSVLKTSAVGSSKKASSDDSKLKKKSHSLNPDSQVHLPGNSTQVAMHCTTIQQAAGKQDGTAVVQNNPVSRSQLQIHSLQSPVHPPTDEGQGILYNIMQQQANITAQLVHRGDVASLPPRVIPIFDGDPLQFAAFIQAFEHGIERKTTNAQDCLYYLELYTVLKRTTKRVGQKLSSYVSRTRIP